MADISKINAVLLANIAEIDDVLAANIAKVNGLVFSTAPAVGTPTAAYSVRLLGSAVGISSYTGPAMRIRRSGDDIEADVEFDTNNEISLTSPISNASSGTYTDLADFVDHTGTPRDAFVDEWKDQSGNANHAAQATAAAQPQIYDASTGLITENAKPALQFDGFTDQMLTGNISTSDKTMIAVYRPTAVPAGSVQDILCGQRTSNAEGNWSFLAMTASDDCQFLGYGSVNKLAASSPTFNQTQKLAEVYYSSGTGSLYRDSTLLDSSSSMTLQSQNVSFYIGNRSGANEFAAFRGQEIILWASDESSFRTSIETNINDHYLIGNFPNPTSGLLATYTGAAAAYSVRQLANTAALAMRIREDGTDTETDIGFDSNGDLDTAAIASHCGSNNGYVVTWYDQAGSQVDATQSTTASQPQIYNGTAVITENGKPALEFDGTNDRLDAGDNGDTTGNLSIFSVAQTDETFVNYGSIISKSAAANVANRWSASLLRSIYKDSTGAGPLLDMTNVNTQQLASYIYLGGSSMTIYQDGSQDKTASLSGSAGDNSYHLLVGGYGDSTGTGGVYQVHRGTIQEVVYYNADKSSNRSGIETNINNYFSVF